MKSKIVMSVALSAIATGAAAAPDYGYAPPPAGAPGVVPSLYASEQGAYAGIEGLMQATESWIIQRGGCAASGGSKKFAVEVSTDYNGSGYASLTLGPTLNLRVSRVSNHPTRGNTYEVGGGGTINGSTIANFSGRYSYNIGSSIMASNVVTWTNQTGVRPADAFSGTVIKDFWRADYTLPGDGVVSSVWDYGLQQVSKLGYPYNKYWQASRTWRHDGIDAETHFLKTRIAPTNSCQIAVDLIGTAGIDSFFQTGYLTVYGPAVLPTKQ